MLFRSPNSKSKLGKRENHEKQTFGSWLTAAPVCFQVRRTLLLRNRSAPAICVAVVEVWREGRDEAEEWREPAICVAVVEVRREGREEAEQMA